jgi:hypothetical protein
MLQCPTRSLHPISPKTYHFLGWSRSKFQHFATTELQNSCCLMESWDHICFCWSLSCPLYGIIESCCCVIPDPGTPSAPRHVTFWAEMDQNFSTLPPLSTKTDAVWWSHDTTSVAADLFHIPWQGSLSHVAVSYQILAPHQLQDMSLSLFGLKWIKISALCHHWAPKLMLFDGVTTPHICCWWSHFIFYVRDHWVMLQCQTRSWHPNSANSCLFVSEVCL